MYAGNPDPSPNLNPNPNFTNPRRNLDFYNPNKGTWILQPEYPPLHTIIVRFTLKNQLLQYVSDFLRFSNI